MGFKILHKDKKTNARIGIIDTKSGSVETPFFMPVATKATAKYLNPRQLEELKSKAIISNALILSLRPGTKTLKKMGGIKKFMNHAGINVTDSGGFQMYSDSIFIKSSERGVYFKNPISGEKLFVTPEQDMKMQLDIGSDIAMCLDSMPLYEHSKDQIKESVRLTSLWAKRCKESHDRLQKNLPKGKRQLLFGITQGGIYPQLRRESANQIISLGFDGIAIGGFGMGETFQEEMVIVKQQKEIFPEELPVYLMGIGSPLEILEAISMGCDMFDSRLPTQSARRGTLFSSKGKIKILNKKYEYDKNPIDKDCDCFVCKNYTRAYVKHLLKEEEPVGKELASYHNIFYLNNLIKQAKQAIKDGKFKEFKDKIKKVYP